jgi:hypothetical protein
MVVIVCVGVLDALSGDERHHEYVGRKIARHNERNDKRQIAYSGDRIDKNISVDGRYAM